MMLFFWGGGIDLSAGLQNCSKRVRTPVTVLRSLSDKYHRERWNTLIPAMGLIESLMFFLKDGFGIKYPG